MDHFKRPKVATTISWEDDAGLVVDGKPLGFVVEDVVFTYRGDLTEVTLRIPVRTR